MKRLLILLPFLVACASKHAALSESHAALTAAGGQCVNVSFDCTTGACNVSLNGTQSPDAGVPAPLDAGSVDASVPVADASIPPPARDASSPPVSIPPSSSARPSYSKGIGFYTVGSKLYDANGQEFIVRGLNRVHWDSNSPGIAATGANVQRWIIDFSRPAATNVAMLSKADVAQRRVTAPGNWDGTCKNDASILSGIVDTWVAQASDWNTLERASLINIANEWGPPAAGSTAWRDSYITAIGRMRAAGYHGTLMVDAPGCGQDPDAIPMYGSAILAADPEHNILFSQHVYGYYGDPSFPGQAWSQTTLVSQIARLRATGLPIVIGEFGPGRNIGPSPTTMPPEFVMQQASQAGFGWLAWAWDDGSASGRDDTWFAMSRDGTYTQSSDLTMFGVSVVENPVYGLKAVAKQSSAF